MLDDGGYLEFRRKANKTKSKKRAKKAKTKKIKTKGKSEAKKVAEKTLKDSLKQEYSINLTVDGDVKYCAGCIIELDDSFGRFAGRYVIDKVTHNIDGDYSCDIEAFKVGARQNAEDRAKAIDKAKRDKKEKEKEARKKARKKERETKKANKTKNKKVVSKNAGYLEARRSK
jgi:hypothetical protein